MLYRLLDGADVPPDDMNKIRAIENEVFLNIKAEIEKETGQTWDGNKSVNKLADSKVARCFKKSFMNYESNRGSEDKKYFKF